MQVRIKGFDWEYANNDWRHMQTNACNTSGHSIVFHHFRFHCIKYNRNILKVVQKEKEKEKLFSHFDFFYRTSVALIKLVWENS